MKAMRMRFSVVLFALSLLSAGACGYGQTAPGPSANEAPSIPTASSILRPALGSIGSGLATVRLDKWKVPGRMREEANANISSISRDLDGMLPTLLATADAKPASIAGTLPVYRNVDALYDVLLRVTETADRGAPKEQAAALHNALAALEAARHALGDSLLEASVLQDAKISRLEAGLQAQRQTVIQAAPCPAVTETHHAARRRRKSDKREPAKREQEMQTPQTPPK
jgi:hypothetical protein